MPQENIGTILGVGAIVGGLLLWALKKKEPVVPPGPEPEPPLPPSPYHLRITYIEDMAGWPTEVLEGDTVGIGHSPKMRQDWENDTLEPVPIWNTEIVIIDPSGASYPLTEIGRDVSATYQYFYSTFFPFSSGYSGIHTLNIKLTVGGQLMDEKILSFNGLL